MLFRSPPERNEKEPEWTKVERVKKTKKPKKTGVKNKEKKTPARLPEAIAVKTRGDSSYADILRKLKTEIDPESFGVKVSGIRRTRSGELLVEIKRGTGKAMDLKKAVAETLGKEATVRTMARRIVLAIRDLDEATSEAEVV